VLLVKVQDLQAHLGRQAQTPWRHTPLRRLELQALVQAQLMQVAALALQ
jgi:hypothetical protein